MLVRVVPKFLCFLFKNKSYIIDDDDDDDVENAPVNAIAIIYLLLKYKIKKIYKKLTRSTRFLR